MDSIFAVYVLVVVGSAFVLLTVFGDDGQPPVP